MLHMTEKILAVCTNNVTSKSSIQFKWVSPKKYNITFEGDCSLWVCLSAVCSNTLFFVYVVQFSLCFRAIIVVPLSTSPQSNVKGWAATLSQWSTPLSCWTCANRVPKKCPFTLLTKTTPGPLTTSSFLLSHAEYRVWCPLLDDSDVSHLSYAIWWV